MSIEMFLVGAVLLLISSSVDANLDNTGFENERIIAGSEARAGQFPYACALYLDADFICTCSIISSKHILTSGHCVITNDTQRFHAIANLRRSADDVFMRLAKVFVHPNYNGTTLYSDIAVFEIDGSLTLGRDGNPPIDKVCLPRSGTSEFKYLDAIALGWGNTNPINTGAMLPDVLRFVRQKVMFNFECAMTYPRIFKGEDQLCTKALWLKGGVCNGDSGGPLVNVRPGRRDVQMGVTSYINALLKKALGCGSYPAVFARVSAHAEWIKNVTQNADICFDDTESIKTG